MHKLTTIDKIQERPSGRSCIMIFTSLKTYHNLNNIVSKIFSSLKLPDRDRRKGRKPALTNTELVTATLFKQKQNIVTIKSLFEILEPDISYQKFVEGLNRIAPYLARITAALLNLARKTSSLIKFTDATDLPVCLNKNANHHKTMKGIANWSKTGKGLFFGLKLHLSADSEGRVLSLKFTSGNSNDRDVFRRMNGKLKGLFVADAGYVCEKLEREFFIENERMLITGSRKNMKKLATATHIFLLNFRMRVEIHFRILKLCFGLVTSFPRSVDGYLRHYLSTITAYLIA